jgi:hypothetical protein
MWQARTVQIPKLIVRVRFPSPAPQQSSSSERFFERWTLGHLEAKNGSWAISVPLRARQRTVSCSGLRCQF